MLPRDEPSSSASKEGWAESGARFGDSNASCYRKAFFYAFVVRPKVILRVTSSRQCSSLYLSGTGQLVGTNSAQ